MHKKKEKVFKSDEMPRIRHLYVRDILPNLDIAAFDNLKNKEEIKALLPSKINQKISFVMCNTHTAIANAIRHIVLMELRVRALDIDITDISTNDKEIMLAELKDRISFIPIDQNIPLDTVFSLSASNSDTKQDYLTVRSKSLVQVGGKVLPEPAFSSTFRLLKLKPGRVIEIPNIRVVEGFGYIHSKFSLTSEFKFQVRDYVDIECLNEKGNIIRKMVKRDELINVLISKKVSHPLIKEKGEKNDINRRLYNWKILLVPNSAYLGVVSKRMLHKIQSCDVVLEDVDIQDHSSSKVEPKEYFLEFTTYGNIQPLQMMRNVCDNIIDRLEHISNIENLVVIEDSEKTRILIRGEDHVMSGLLKRIIFDLDPSIGLINSKIEHPELRVVIINIIHSAPMEIFFDAVKKLKTIFKDLRSQFV